MRMVAPESHWKDIELPEVPVAVADVDVPFLVLGSSALVHVVVLIRDEEQFKHIKPLDMFQKAKHYTDDAF